MFFKSLTIKTMSLALLICLANSCRSGISTPEELADLSDVTVEVYGGRERILCEWSGVPASLKILRLDLGTEGEILDIPLQGSEGRRYFSSIKGQESLGEV